MPARRVLLPLLLTPFIAASDCPPRVLIPEVPPALQVTVSPSAWEMVVGQTRVFTATVAGGDADTNRAVTWRLSNPAIGTLSVDGNTVTLQAVRAGTATLIATTVHAPPVTAAATVRVFGEGS